MVIVGSWEVRLCPCCPRLPMQRKPEAKTMDPLYSTHDVAQLIQVDASTVSKWINKPAEVEKAHSR
jgi:hypothetical protein